MWKKSRKNYYWFLDQGYWIDNVFFVDVFLRTAIRKYEDRRIYETGSKIHIHTSAMKIRSNVNTTRNRKLNFESNIFYLCIYDFF